MNVLFLTLLDFDSIDDRSIYTDLLREFARDNHNLYIVSPTEKRRNISTFLVANQNVNILKLQIGNIQKTNLFEKGITTLLLEPMYVSGIKRYFKNIKFDLVLYSTPPITLQKAVNYVKKRDNAKSYLLLKDIFPQNAIDLGMLRKTGIKSPIYYFFKNKERQLYKISDFIGCMSVANVEYLLRHNQSIHRKNVDVCPNSIEPNKIYVSDQEKIQVRNKYKIPVDKTIFIYGGNLGKPQGIDFLIDCIRANEINENSFFCIVGSGTEHDKLFDFFESFKPKNSVLQKQLPKADYELLANTCDIGLLFLDKRFTIPNFPSRILSYMQASMPVLAATDINTDIGEIIEKGNFGFWCESGNLEGFNSLVNKLCDKELRESLGKNARIYLEEHYTAKHSYDIIMQHFD